VEARHSYGVVLALMQSYPQAVAQLEAVIRLRRSWRRRGSIWPTRLAAMGG
jgi:hypothetical protein